MLKDISYTDMGRKSNFGFFSHPDIDSIHIIVALHDVRIGNMHLFFVV